MLLLGYRLCFSNQNFAHGYFSSILFSFLGFLDGPFFSSVHNCFPSICEANSTPSHIFKLQTHVRLLLILEIILCPQTNKLIYGNCEYICQFHSTHFCKWGKNLSNGFALLKWKFLKGRSRLFFWYITSNIIPRTEWVLHSKCYC